MKLWRGLHRVLEPVAASARLFDAMTRQLLFVFNYHEVNDRPSAFSRDFGLNVPPRTFARQLRWMKDHFDMISPSQLLSGEFSLPAALVTFDDGFKSAFDEAAVSLKREKVPAVIFMNMGPVRGEPFWSGVVTYLCGYDKSFQAFVAGKYGRPFRSDFFLRCTPADLEEFRAAGHGDSIDAAGHYYGTFACEDDLRRSESLGLYLGNHLFNHYNAAALHPDELRRQYQRNDEAMAGYANRVKFFSYPFGQPGSCYNRRTDESLMSLGAKRLFTAFPAPNRRRDAHRLHRISMFDYIETENAFRTSCLVPYVNEAIRSPRLRYF